MEHEEEAFQIRSMLRCFHHYHPNTRVPLLHGLWNHQELQKASQEQNAEDKPNNTANRSVRPKSQPFSTKIELPHVSFPNLSQCGQTVTLCGIVQ